MLDRITNHIGGRVTDQPEILTRQQARDRGLKHYFTGKPCPSGHFSPKNVHSKVCAACHRERAARARAERGDRVKEIKAASYVRHRAKALAKSKAYQEANKPKIKTRAKAFRAANRERINKRMSEYAKANRDLMRVHERRRKARHRNAPGSHTLADIRAIEESQGMRCVNPRCLTDLVGGYHVDHIQPLAKFGCNCANNLQLLCEPCNQAKGDKAPADWLREVGHQPSP